jgi:hypothetical protein
MLVPQFTEQPVLGETPLSLHCRGRHVQHVGCLLLAQATVEAEFDHPTLAVVEDL